jgi:hypothetical protein
MWTNHRVTVDEADEALADVDALWLDPDPKSKSGSSIRVIGYCPSRREILTVVLVRESRADWLWGAKGWLANSTDRAKYRQPSE